MSIQHEKPTRALRALAGAEMNRRDLLKRAVLFGASVPTVGVLLSACDDDDEVDAVADDESTDDDDTDPDPVADPDDDEADDELVDDPDDDAVSTEGRHGGQLIIGGLGEARTMNPIQANTASEFLRGNFLYDQFVNIDPEDVAPSPRLAEGWEISDDATGFTFTLRDGLEFSDGSPLTMDDVSFFIHRVLEPDSTATLLSALSDIQGAPAFNAGDADEVSGVEVEDDHTLTITLDEPNVAFLVTLRHVYPVPKALLEDSEDFTGDPFWQNPVGAGPFTFASWTPDEDFVVERNENYWQEDKPYLDRIIIRSIPDSETLVLALETGEIDSTTGALPTVASHLEDVEGLVIDVPGLGGPDAFGLNQSHEQLAIKNVRKAIAHAVNLEQFVDDFLLGLGEPAAMSPMAPDHWAMNQNLQPYEYDLDRARELLEEAGYPDGGFSIEVTTNAGNVMREDFLTFFQSSLAEIGITVEPNLIEWSQVVEAWSNGTFDLIMGPAAMSSGLDPDELYDILHSESSRNVLGYSNPDADALLQAGRVEVDEDARKEIYDELQEIWWDDVPIYWAWHRPYIYVHKRSVQGTTLASLSVDGGPYALIENLYIDEDA